MTSLLEPFAKCLLFSGVESALLSQLLTGLKFSVREYAKDTLVANEEDSCTTLGIVLEGSVEAQKIYASGKILTLAKMGPGQMFGEVIVFTSTHRYPATIIAMEKSRILFIHRDEIVRLCSEYPLVLRNFMEFLSNRILMLNKRIRELSYVTIRQKIAGFLLEEYKRTHSKTIVLTLSRESLALQMGIQRPSLSRELIKMREDGLIDFCKNRITILDPGGIEDEMI